MESGELSQPRTKESIVWWIKAIESRGEYIVVDVIIKSKVEWTNQLM